MTSPKKTAEPEASREAPAFAPPQSTTACDLGFDFKNAAPWFPHHQDAPYVLVRVSDAHAKSWAEVLGIAVRRCYVSDAIVQERSKATGATEEQIIAARLPDPG